MSLPLSRQITWPICLMTMGARPSEGSSMISRSGFIIRARPTASICCSPPLSRLAGSPARSFRIGKEVVHRLQIPGAFALGRLLHDGQVLFDAQRLEYAAPLRDEGYALAGDAMRRKAADDLVLEAYLAVRGRSQAHDGADDRALAHAVAARAWPPPCRPGPPGRDPRAPAAPSSTCLCCLPLATLIAP